VQFLTLWQQKGYYAFLLPGQAKGLVTVYVSSPCLSIQKGQKTLREQKGQHIYIPQRASLTPQARAPLTNRPLADDVLEEDERYYPVRPASSAIRYTTMQGEEVIQSGNKRVIIHHEPPPSRQQPQQQVQTAPATKQHKHWLFWLGSIFCIMLIGWTVLSVLSGFLAHKRDDLLFGNPRTYQTDATVGHYGRVSHFTVINLDGYIEIFETQRGHPEAAKIYTPTALLINPTDPVILTFQDVNGDDKPDMIITAPSFQEVMFNNGTSFQSQPPQPNH
jgi:hypothetical protein